MPIFWVREKKQASSEVDLAKHPYAIRIYAGELKIEKTKTPAGKPYLLMNLPYYLGTKIQEYVHWFVDSYKL